jgi:hypothetical protein
MKRERPLPGWVVLVPALIFMLGIGALVSHTSTPSANPERAGAPGGGIAPAVSGVAAPPATPGEVAIEQRLRAKGYVNIRRVGENTWEGTDGEGRGVLITRRR